MNKNLPNVYQVPINKKIKNNKETFKSNEDMDRGEKISITEINKIFNAKDHVYKTKVEIKTRNGKKIVEAVGLTNDAILTLNGENIPITDILDIKKV